LIVIKKMQFFFYVIHKVPFYKALSAWFFSFLFLIFLVWNFCFLDQNFIFITLQSLWLKKNRELDKMMVDKMELKYLIR
jgi:hypothetical protein